VRKICPFLSIGRDVYETFEGEECEWFIEGYGCAVKLLAEVLHRKVVSEMLKGR